MADKAQITMPLETLGLIQTMLIGRVQETIRLMAFAKAVGAMNPADVLKANAEIERITAFLTCIPQNPDEYKEWEADPEMRVIEVLDDAKANPRFVEAMAKAEALMEAAGKPRQ